MDLPLEEFVRLISDAAVQATLLKNIQNAQEKEWDRKHKEQIIKDNDMVHITDRYR